MTEDYNLIPRAELIKGWHGGAMISTGASQQEDSSQLELQLCEVCMFSLCMVTSATIAYCA